MSGKPLTLSDDEQHAVLAMRDAKMAAGDASHMSRILIALLRSNEFDGCSDYAEWLGEEIRERCTIIDEASSSVRREKA